MLKTHNTEIDLKDIFEELSAELSNEYENFLTEEEIVTINYPVEKSFSSYKNVSFGASQTIEGVLHGIKGQYLILDNGQAFNVRKHAGFYINLEVKENPVLSLF